jgi:penicillin amidase
MCWRSPGRRCTRATRNRDEFLAALREFHAPHQNIVFADREGRVGFVAPALVPVRRPDNEAMGRVPVPGWLAKYDWTGLLAYEDMPAVHNPPTQRIVTANHKITPQGYRPFLSVDWFLPYRADRIDELLEAVPKHTLESFGRIQADTISRLARELLPVAQAAKPETEEGRKAQALLATWKADMAIDSPAPLAFMAWYRELTRLVYADELGDMFKDNWDQRAGLMIPVMRAENGYERWCDDVRTPEKEACAGLAARAFDLAAKDLEQRFGAPSSWRWGRAHPAASDHRPFGFVPVISRFFNVAPETPGDSFTVNVGHMTIRDEARPYANRHAASLRAIYDLSDLDKSLYMQSTGQSGNIFSPWYASFGERWAKVEYITIRTRQEEVRAVHRLRLMPAE